MQSGDEWLRLSTNFTTLSSTSSIIRDNIICLTTLTNVAKKLWKQKYKLQLHSTYNAPQKLPSDSFRGATTVGGDQRPQLKSRLKIYDFKKCLNASTLLHSRDSDGRLFLTLMWRCYGKRPACRTWFQFSARKVEARPMKAGYELQQTDAKMTIDM